MKKIIAAVVFCSVLFMSALSFTNAAYNIVEKPDIKVVVDGRIIAYQDAPIVVNGRTLLPLRALLASLGVQNDDQHILWNGNEQSVTFYKDTREVYLKVNSDRAIVDGEEISLDAAPVNYRGRVYIPVRFVSQALGKKVVWENNTSSVLIRNENEFNSIKGILEKSDTAMKAVSRLRFNMNADILMSVDSAPVNSVVAGTGEVDRENRTMHAVMDMSLLGNTVKLEYFMGDGTIYDRNSLTNKWKKTAFLKVQYDKLFGISGDTLSLNTSDSLCAGLVLYPGSSPDEIVLKGDAYLDELFGIINFNISVTDIEFTKYYLEITMNRDTYLVSKAYMDIQAAVKSNPDKQQLQEKITCTYSDYNGDFKLDIPVDFE